MKMICACATDRGNYREVNQDAVLIRRLRQGEKEFVLGAVFDGIGGLEYGEIASGTLRTEMNRWYEDVCAWIDLTTMDPEVIFSHFRDQAELLNEKIRQIRLVIHVGDSRIYKWKQGFLECITDDDVIAKYVEGVQRNYLSNYMGKSDELIFAEYSGKIQEGETLLFCSDGFYHQLVERDLQAIGKVNDEKELETLIKKLIQTMISRGEHDNISAGIIKGNNSIKKRKRIWKSKSKED